MTHEETRLAETRDGKIPWKQWGPYLSERQWGTVREDYSPLGDAWSYFPHDHARSRAYRWGEDGIAGISDDKQRLCFALALWNGADPIIKERMFGLTNAEGNHGEDVKEYYFYLDSTPTHSYMKYLYKYPQNAYPYDDLVATNSRRGRTELEYELIDTGVFNENRYFDVFVEYAKAGPDDILVQITVHNRGPTAALLHLLPTLWFRNTWSWHPGSPKPNLQQHSASGQPSAILASHPALGDFFLHCDSSIPLLFTENETNNHRIFGNPNESPYVKDAIDEFLVHGNTEAVNPAHCGTKASAHYFLSIDPGQSQTVRLRLSAAAPADPFGQSFDETFAARRREADAFYDTVIPATCSDDQRNVMRQAFAGMLWSKQYYYFDVDEWRTGDAVYKNLAAARQTSRNRGWSHLLADDIISMPDKWEYPWFAAWDLAFHCVTFSLIDVDLAKEQLELMARAWYTHPNGQIPAYEWNFTDVNPPVHSLATWRVYTNEQRLHGVADRAFLERMFHKLLLNFTWWVNRKDSDGRNVFQGGFLGLDNIGVFDRSDPLPTGGSLEQSDGTSWMALYSLNMMEIALELAKTEPAYLEMAYKFYEHFIHIACAMDRIGNHEDELWDEHDGFFYDLLLLPGGAAVRLKIRSLVGLLSVAAAVLITPDEIHDVPRAQFASRMAWLASRNPEIACKITNLDKPSPTGIRLLSVLSETKLRRVLARLLDESEFLSPYGIRSLSRYHQAHPFIFTIDRHLYRVDYEPAESSTGLFGGNSNWRGPVWMPMNVILCEALAKLHLYYGEDFKIECPTGSGNMLNLREVGEELIRRATRIFLRDDNGRRPVYGGAETFQTDPHWRDYLLFYEYFHGDNGAGIGASHQTGWTGLIANFIRLSVTGLEKYQPKPIPEPRKRSPERRAPGEETPRERELKQEKGPAAPTKVSEPG